MKKKRQKKTRRKEVQVEKTQRPKLYETILFRNGKPVFYVSKKKATTMFSFLLAFLLIGTASVFLFDKHFFERHFAELKHYVLATDDANKEKKSEYLDDYAEIYVANKDEAPPDPTFLNKYPRWSRKIYNEITPATTNYTEAYEIASYSNGDKYDELTEKVGSPTSVTKNTDESEITTYHASWSMVSDYQTDDNYYVSIEVEYEARENQIISKTFRADQTDDY